MNTDRPNFSEQLLQCETPDEGLREKYEKEIQAMLEKQLGPTGRALWWFWTVFCAAQAILFVVIGVWSYGKLPIWGTIGFGASALRFLGEPASPSTRNESSAPPPKPST